MIGKTTQINNLLSTLLSESNSSEDSNDNNIFKTNKNSRDSDNDIDELQIKNRKYLHSEIAINSHSLWRRKGFWESALLEGVISQITISDGDQSWDDLPPDQLKEAVIG